VPIDKKKSRIGRPTASASAPSSIPVNPAFQADPPIIKNPTPIKPKKDWESPNPRRGPVAGGAARAALATRVRARDVGAKKLAATQPPIDIPPTLPVSRYGKGSAPASPKSSKARR